MPTVNFMLSLLKGNSYILKNSNSNMFTITNIKCYKYMHKTEPECVLNF